MNVMTAKDYRDLSRKAAGTISAQVILYPDSVLGLATGSTPIGIYEQLAEWHQTDDLDFSGVTTINLDEYCGLTSDNEQSYHAYMERHLFGKTNLSRSRVFLPDGIAPDLDAECRRYDALIEEKGGIDLQLLGLGHNGHIGFNEPGDAFELATHVVELGEATIQANARFFPDKNDVPRRAVTMGIKSIMHAKKILLVVCGGDKQEILNRTLYGAVHPEVPASILQLHPNLTVIYSPVG